MLPNFLGLGPPKAGTTWLFKCLQDHPDVFIPSVKETRFFMADDCEQRLDEYEAYFEPAGNERAVGEITVRYLVHEPVAARVHRTVPDAKLFVVLRNPVDRLYSHYWHLHRQGFHAKPGEAHQEYTVEEAMERFTPLLVDGGMYHRHLLRWLEFFDREQLLILFYDDIKSDPASLVRRVYEFLDVDADFEPPSLTNTGGAVRRGVSPRNKIMGAMHHGVRRVLIGGVYRPMQKILGKRRAAQLRERSNARRILSGVFMREGYPPLPDHLRRRLTDLYADDVAALERLTGRETSWK